MGNVGNGGPSIQATEIWAKNNSNGLPCIRWTCPQTGNYQFTASFIGNDSRGVNNNVYIVLNNNMQYSNTILQYQETQTYTSPLITLQAGDTIDLLVEWDGNGDSEYGWIGVNATIQQL